MALLKELTDYRKTIMKALCSDQKIVDLITNTTNATVPNRNLMYKQIFPYAYTPDVNKETSTFIDFRVGSSVIINKTYKEMEITFYIFTHQSLMRTSDGLRPDKIAEALEELFNGSRGLGLGRVQLNGMEDISPTTDYHGIALQYTVLEFNRPSINGDSRQVF